MFIAKTRIATLFRRPGESGTAAIEFAVGSLFLLPLLLGTADLGLAAFEWTQVNDLVQAQTLYVAKNASALYYANPFDPSVITGAVSSSGGGMATAAIPQRFCSCPTPTGITGGTAFAAPPADPCPAALTCNLNTTPPSAYVLVSASHTHVPIVTVSWWPSLIFTSTAVVRIH